MVLRPIRRPEARNTDEPFSLHLIRQTSIKDFTKPKQEWSKEGLCDHIVQHIVMDDQVSLSTL